MATSPEARLKALNLTLPPPPRPMARYKIAVRTGNLLFISGHGPAKLDDGSPVTGRCGADLTVEQGGGSGPGLVDQPLRLFQPLTQGADLQQQVAGIAHPCTPPDRASLSARWVDSYRAGVTLSALESAPPAGRL